MPGSCEPGIFLPFHAGSWCYGERVPRVRMIDDQVTAVPRHPCYLSNATFVAPVLRFFCRWQPFTVHRLLLRWTSHLRHNGLVSPFFRRCDDCSAAPASDR